VPLTVDLMQFSKVFKQAGETTLVDLKIDSKADGKDEKVLIKDVQYHPVSLKPIHASFHKVNLTEKITAQIPVEITGDDKNELVKSGNALVLLLMNDITVEALPMNLPHKITVDVSGLAEVDAAITVAQLNIDKATVKIVNAEPDELVVKLANAQMAEEEEEVVEAPISEAEAIAKMEATKELSEEEKAKRAEEEKKEKGKDKE